MIYETKYYLLIKILKIVSNYEVLQKKQELEEKQMIQ
jgi:hypothetical protein